MLNENSGLVKLVLSILLFPTFFQEAFLLFAWGAGDPLWIMMGKRLFLLLPVAAIILACWLSVACFLTVIIRPNRQEYVKNIFIKWWELGKSIALFWGGIFKFVFHLAVSGIAFIRVAAIALWALIHEFVLMPFRLISNMGRNVAASSIPWIAVLLTFFWCLIEAMVFTYVTTPLVVDTFSNITGENLSETFIRIPLFVFMFFVVMGSYAVLSTFVDSFSKKNVVHIIGIGVIEIVVLFVEVMFLYREFVDALVPWFAQYSANFELGIVGLLSISTFVWFGIRSLSWFLFASHGTPTIMLLIRGKGSEIMAARKELPVAYKPVSSNFMDKIKQDMAWVRETGETVLAAFIIPPLQVVGASINFCMMLITGDELFHLPFETMDDLSTSGKEEIPPSSPNGQPKVVPEQPAARRKEEPTQPSFGGLQDVKTQ